MLEVEIKQNIDSNLYSMGKEKKGRNPDKLSLASKKRKKVAEAREKKKQQEKEKKLKPLPKSGLGSKSPAEKKGLSMATRSSPRNRPGPH